MKSFSLLRVAQYARYHYSVTRFNYLSFILAAIGITVLFGMLQGSLYIVNSMLVPIYLFGGISMAVSTTRTMRDRGKKVLDSVLPVSTAERHLFNVINLSVVYPILFAVVAAVALGITAIFNECGFETFSSAYMLLVDETLLLWFVYVFVQIVCSASLLINILARRSLIIAYTMVFFGFMAAFFMFVWSLDWLSYNVEFNFVFCLDESDFDTVAYVAKVIYSIIPVVLYALGYVALRKRQVKW